MQSDIVAVFLWWLLLQAMGWAALPLVFRLLRWLPDRGYTLAKPAGLLLGNYVLWLFGSLGWLRNTEGGILIAFGIVALLSAWVYRRWGDASNLTGWIRAHARWVIAYEVVFVAALVGWAIFRAHNPDLSSTEKPMEFAFLNAIRRSPIFPPHDPWLSGFAVSYYYFGYVMMSTLTKLSGVVSGVAFGLSNALWFALTAAGAFGIVANLAAASKRAGQSAIVAAGLLGALFVPVLGNFEGPLEVAHASGVGSPEFWRWLDIQEINTPPNPIASGEARWPFCDGERCPSHPRGWWWWRASRVVHDYPLGSDRTDPTQYQELIDEFPFFSFLLGDMHPHVLALPFTLMAMALAFNLFEMAANGRGAGAMPGASAEAGAQGVAAKWRAHFWDLAPIALLYPIFLGGLSFLNTWDFPIYVFVAALAWTLGRWAGAVNASASRSLWLDGFVALVACGVLGVVAYAPFYVSLRSQAGGIVPNVYNPTAVQQFFVMFGPFLLFGAVFLVSLLARAVQQRRLSVLTAAAGSLSGAVALVAGAGLLTALASMAVVAISSSARDKVNEWTAVLGSQGASLTQVILQRLADFGVPLLLGLVMAAAVLAVRSRSARPVDDGNRLPAEGAEPVPFALMLILVGALLSFVVEFVFLLDFFGTRMNTVFKLYYQTWALWGVASAYAVYYLWQSPERLTSLPGRVVLAGVVLLSVAAGLVYPLLAIRDKVDLSAAPTLDARAPTRQFAADEYAAIEWLDRAALDRPVVLEAWGDSYRDYTSRVSGWTGLPTVLGWIGHEGQWRGTYQDITPRQHDVDTLYTTTDTGTALALIRKYDIVYVYVGPHERQKYPGGGLAKFAAMMDVAFQSGEAILYRTRE